MSDEKEKLPERLYIEYIYSDINPSKTPSTLTRLQYFTSLDEERTQYYEGASFYHSRRTKEDLEAMVLKGALIKLETPFVLEWKNDLWLKTDGTIIAALAHAPWETEVPIEVGKMSKSFK